MSTGGSSSSRRPPRSPASGLRNDQINALLSKLLQILPAEIQDRLRSDNQVSASQVLKETCDYIKKLHEEVGDLSGRLAELLANTDDPNQASIIRALLDGNN